MRQISQGVEDLTWKTPKASDKNEQVAETMAPSILEPSVGADEKASGVEDAVISNVKDEDSQQSARSEMADKDVNPEADKNTDAAILSVPVAPLGQAHVRSPSEGGEKGLKRRFGERGTSQGPNDEDSASQDAPEPLKRPRDDGDEDPNPRETKRPSPPPESNKSPTPPSPKPAAKLVSQMLSTVASFSLHLL